MASKYLNFASAVRKDMYNRNDTQDMILAEVSRDGMLLRNVRHQTYEICCAALGQNWRALSFVHDLNRCIVDAVVRHSPEAASLLPPAFHLYATCVNINCFDFIAKPTLECCRYVIQKMPEWISKRPNPPLELCLMTVKARFEDAKFRAYMNSPYRPASEYLQRDYLEGMRVTEAVLADLQKAALAVTNGWALLAYPLAAQERLVEEAVNINAAVYTHVPHLHTDALNRVVCMKNHTYLAILTNPPRDLVWDIATSWPVAIKYAEEQDEALCVHAVRSHPTAIAHVRKARLHIWAKAGYKTLPQLTTLFPEFVPTIVRSEAARAFFARIQRAMATNGKPSTTHKPAAAAAVAAAAVELEDPVTLEPVAPGTVCAFLADDKGIQHFAGTLDSLLDLLKAGFHGSTPQNLFIPIKNALVPTRLIRWRTV